MNKILLMILLCSFVYNNPNFYWDLGVGIVQDTKLSDKSPSIDLSTFHRLEGLKKYYNDNFSGALFHFEELNSANKTLILYEHAYSYYSIGEYQLALSILEGSNYNSDNILYLKSQVFLMLEDYDAAILILKSLSEKFPTSDYLDIIKFDLEKINLLK
tara:strand:+ start:837 stop:1310 length:474 start_codon:yes stop_codon:yes gene_type:complete